MEATKSKKLNNKLMDLSVVYPNISYLNRI